VWIQTKRGQDREWAAEHLAEVDREKCCDVACGDTSKFVVSGGAGGATQLIVMPPKMWRRRDPIIRSNYCQKKQKKFIDFKLQAVKTKVLPKCTQCVDIY